MCNENKTIHDFDLNQICEYFCNMERVAPGVPEATLKAPSFIYNLTIHSQIADLGCGNTAITFFIAKKTEL